MTVYLVQNGWAAEAVGFALTLSTVASLVSQVPAGALIDRLGDKRRAVQVGVAGVGVGVAALLLALSAARPGVYLAQALQGLPSSLVAPGIAAISLAAVGLCLRAAIVVSDSKLVSTRSSVRAPIIPSRPA